MDRLDLRNDPSPSEPADEAPERSLDDPERLLWAQFAEATTVESFCRAWLALQCGMIHGVSGGVVLLGPPDRGPFSPVAVWPSPRSNVTHLTPTAERALKERRGLVQKRDPASGEASTEERYDIAYPLEAEGRLHGVIVLDVGPRPQRQMQRVLRQLYWGSAWLTALFPREEAARNAATKERLQTLADLLATAFGHEQFFAAATAFVTAVATRLDCDRVSVGFVKGGRARVRAMSHSAHFGKQTNLVRAVEAAMDEAIDQQETVVHPPPAEGRIQVTRAHADLAQQHGAGAICSIPLSDGGRILGALTLERGADKPFDQASVDLLEALAALGGPLLELQRRDDRWLWGKAAESAHRLADRMVGPGHLGLKLSLAAAAGLVLFFAFARGDFRVSATTVLEPVVRQAAVAPFSGYIAEAPARAGDLVRQGQLLAVLDDREIRLERLKWASQYEQLARQYNQAMALRNAAQVVILAAQMDQSRAEVALRDDQLARTRVTAPFDGIVVTGDLSQALASPVERGQVLFEVAPLDAYRVILQVDERDVAEVAVSQRGTLVLAGAPADGLPFTVQKITPVSTAREGRNYFRVEAGFERAPERLRPGMEGVGKIQIDRRRLIWIWTRQVIDWIRLQLWTWLP